LLRRSFLAASCLAAPWVAAAPRNRIGRQRLSAVTDEIATTPAGAIAFAKLYNLKWLELRAIPGGGGEYARAKEPFLRQAAAELKEAGLGVSFLNTGMLKFGLPGTDVKPSRLETSEQRALRLERYQRQFDERLPYLQSSIRAAEILGVRDIRIFAFTRTGTPREHFPRIAAVINEMAAVAEKAGVRLLLENETSCNAATCAETADLLKLIPSPAVGVNWDAMNGADMKEPAFPQGYALLPKSRLWNVQIKGRSLQDGPKKLDWAALIRALEKDGYTGQLGLETHIFGRMLITHSHICMREMIRLAERA
jgi:sugar phosphate isomerase/epimerase